MSVDCLFGAGFGVGLICFVDCLVITFVCFDYGSAAAGCLDFALGGMCCVCLRGAVTVRFVGG